jgi:hypothetical protein
MARGPLGWFPPEPFRYIGSILVRDAVRRKERSEDFGRRPRWIDQRLSKLAAAAGKADKVSKRTRLDGAASRRSPRKPAQAGH